jgi:nicotinate-nucleotide adenylyltransferase
MPAFIHPFEKKTAPAQERLLMTRLLNNDRIKTSDFEIKKQKVSFTIETLNDLKKRFPKHKFFWVIGSDQLEDFKKWKDWKTLINEGFIIFPRPKLAGELSEYIKKTLKIKEIPNNWLVAKSNDLVLIDISSTLIRKRIKSGRSIKYMVPGKVEKYINEHGLYE